MGAGRDDETHVDDVAVIICDSMLTAASAFDSRLPVNAQVALL
jgi:hypothetical protein